MLFTCFRFSVVSEVRHTISIRPRSPIPKSFCASSRHFSSLHFASVAPSRGKSACVIPKFISTRLSIWYFSAMSPTCSSKASRFSFSPDLRSLNQNFMFRHRSTAARAFSIFSLASFDVMLIISARSLGTKKCQHSGGKYVSLIA